MVSTNEMAEVNAAKNTKMKKIAPTACPNGMLINTWGIVINKRLEPEFNTFASPPENTNTAGRIIQTNGMKTIFTVHTPTYTSKVTLPVLGMHNVLNALSAIAVAQTMRLNLDKVVEKLSEYQPPEMRQTVYHVDGITVIDDSYNASPDSVKSGIDILCRLPNQGKKIAVLADMMELGDMSEQAHFDTGVAVGETLTDVIITVGPRAVKIAEGAASVKPDMTVIMCENNREAIDVLKEIVKKEDAMMIKGSRSMKTDEIVKAFL